MLAAFRFWEYAMLSSTLYLALCVQVADLSSLYLSFEPTGAALEEQMDEAEIRWVEQLRQQTPNDADYLAAMHDGFVQAMAMDGTQFWAQWGQCVAELDAPTSPLPGAKG